MINTYSLFAANVIHCKLPIQFTLHKKIISFVENKYKEGNTISCVNGFQFHDDFEGKEELLKDLNIYLNNNFKKKIIHSWLNVLGNDSYNRPHSHNEDDITHSGVFYLSHENNNIYFCRDSDTFEIKPKIFDLLIFPYNLLHYVLPEKRTEKRICFAFNLESVK
tara:strand:- start:2495 stop:2986 length:492 start_codon:yes stop_codon:yes gene_type:complete